MDYLRIYTALIERCQSREEKPDIIEVHHIQPKSIGGSDDIANLVSLSPREHFIAHKLLAKIYGGNLWFAVVLMSSSKPGRSTNRIYDAEKRKIRDAQVIDKLNSWAIKKGFDNYDHQSQVFWNMFMSGYTQKDISSKYKANETTISRSLKHHINNNNLHEEYNKELFNRRSIVSKHTRALESEESKEKRNAKNRAAGWRGPKQGCLGDNPAAVKIWYKGVFYRSMKEAALAHGKHRNSIKRDIKNNVEGCRYA